MACLIEISEQRRVLWVLYRPQHIVIAELLSSLPPSTVSSLRTGTEFYLSLKSYTIHSMFGKFIQSLFFENGLFTEKKNAGALKKEDGNNIIHLLCQAIKKNLVNIS